MQPCECLNCDPLQGKLPLPEENSDSNANFTAKLRLLSLGLILTGSFSLVEYGMGWWSHSLALVADSGHMLSDCWAMGLSLLATCVAQFANRHPSGLNARQAEHLAAVANGVGLLILAGWVAWEAIDRFQSHAAILSEAMLLTAIGGLLFNLLAVRLFHAHSHADLNVRGAFLHLLADTLSSIAVIVAALFIWILHWDWADVVVSLLTSLLIVMGALPFLRESVRALQHSVDTRL